MILKNRLFTPGPTPLPLQFVQTKTGDVHIRDMLCAIQVVELDTKTLH